MKQYTPTASRILRAVCALLFALFVASCGHTAPRTLYSYSMDEPNGGKYLYVEKLTETGDTSRISYTYNGTTHITREYDHNTHAIIAEY